jgi:hypothetical protein
MAKMSKKFDCVEMKNDIQRQLRHDYEMRKGEFASYADFVNSTVNKSDDIRLFRKRISRSKAAV